MKGQKMADLLGPCDKEQLSSSLILKYFNFLNMRHVLPEGDMGLAEFSSGDQEPFLQYYIENYEKFVRTIMAFLTISPEAARSTMAEAFMMLWIKRRDFTSWAQITSFLLLTCTDSVKNYHDYLKTQPGKPYIIDQQWIKQLPVNLSEIIMNNISLR